MSVWESRISEMNRKKVSFLLFGLVLGVIFSYIVDYLFPDQGLITITILGIAGLVLLGLFSINR